MFERISAKGRVSLGDCTMRRSNLVILILKCREVLNPAVESSMHQLIGGVLHLTPIGLVHTTLKMPVLHWRT